MHTLTRLLKKINQLVGARNFRVNEFLTIAVEKKKKKKYVIIQANLIIIENRSMCSSESEKNDYGVSESLF
jgi:hypothetical protein